MGITLSQLWPPAPTLTEDSLTSQKGKVFIITGGYSGVGLALTRILYLAGGTVYIAGRSQDKARAEITRITEEVRDREGCGQLHFLALDLSNLETIKPAVLELTQKEKRLDVLFNNAGISSTPATMRTVQGVEMQMGTNAVGHYLLTELLRPILKETATQAPLGPVRVVWTSSFVVEQQAPIGGLVLNHLSDVPTDRFLNYANSKTANVLLAAELGKESKMKEEGVLHVVQNPGNLSTNLLRYLPAVVYWMVRPILFDARYGAYTELWCGLSDELSLNEDQGRYVIPWGRKHPSFRPDIVDACKGKAEGGSGVADDFRRWCDDQVQMYR